MAAKRTDLATIASLEASLMAADETAKRANEQLDEVRTLVTSRIEATRAKMLKLQGRIEALTQIAADLEEFDVEDPEATMGVITNILNNL